ncbi:uncharacterized protein LOC114520705 [Dendronephthya gigantea]|uniref:uncharacterized protein LOC114520705 n=1 Tax=Dendronephthya gigantea TaxID=151771 RepID=UPI00106B2F1A|nr:uncharacterized protein LOC114520705 [Dendronephthya gigantea]
MTEARATLKNSIGNRYDMPPNSGDSIPDVGLNEAYVNQGTWIFYDSSFTGNGGNFMVVREGDGNVELGFNCVSAREVDYQSDAVALFEHYNFYGVTKTYVNSASELEGFNSGVSSALIFPSAKWDLYSEANFLGLSSQRGPGDYPSAEDLGLPNDTVKSIRRA